MSSTTTGARIAPSLASNYSIEITAKDGKSFHESAQSLPPKTSVSVTFLPGEELADRVATAALVRKLGFVPMPHLSARRLKSQEELTTYLGALKRDASIDRAFVVAGDPQTPMGPFEDALAVIRSGVLAEYGVSTVGIAGYPEGHSSISDHLLWQALNEKQRTLRELGLATEVVTQFVFDSAPTLRWLERVREETGFTGPVRVGIPGPASVKTLLQFASRCGVRVAAGVMAKYGLSITNLLKSAGPTALIHEFEAGWRPEVHGDLRLHLYPFGGLRKTVEFMQTHVPHQATGSGK